VRGAFLSCQGGFEATVDGVGVDHLNQVPARLGQLGGVEVCGLAEQDLLPAAPDQADPRPPGR
jgi:hypothetical protein